MNPREYAIAFGLAPLFGCFGLLGMTPVVAIAEPNAAGSATVVPSAEGIVVRGEVGPKPLPLRAFDVSVRSALLAAQPAPGIAGAALPVIVKAHAVSLPATAPGELAYMGQSDAVMGEALKGTVEQMQLRSRGWFAGKRIELTVAEPALSTDAASATLAVAVAVDAMILGWTPDPAFYALGALQADGQIGPVKLPIPRLLAAFRAGGERIALPDKMWTQVSDLLVSEGVASFSKAQMFTVNGLEEVMALASSPPSEAVQKSSERFGDVQRALQAPGADADAELQRPAIKDALRDVLRTTPNHLTARLLLGRTTGQYRTLSLQGSMTAIEAMGMTILKAARSASPTDLKQLPATSVQAEVVRLKAARAVLDPKSQLVVDAILAYADIVRAWYERPVESGENRAEKNRALYAAAKQIRDLSAQVPLKP